MHWTAPPGTSLDRDDPHHHPRQRRAALHPRRDQGRELAWSRGHLRDYTGPSTKAQLWISIDPTADYGQTVTRLQEVADRYAGRGS